MTRPKRKLKRPAGRVLLPLQRLIVARELHAGVPPKQVAANWKISRAMVAKVFKEYLEYRIEWRNGKEPK